MGEPTMRVDLALMGREITEVKGMVKDIKKDQASFCDEIRATVMGDPKDPINRPGLAGQVRANKARIGQIFGLGKWCAGIMSSALAGIVLLIWKGK